jgi:hypothetical protein
MTHNRVWHFLFVAFLVLFFCSAVILERTEAAVFKSANDFEVSSRRVKQYRENECDALLDQ